MWAELKMDYSAYFVLVKINILYLNSRKDSDSAFLICSIIWTKKVFFSNQPWDKIYLFSDLVIVEDNKSNLNTMF